MLSSTPGYHCCIGFSYSATIDKTLFYEVLNFYTENSWTDDRGWWPHCGKRLENLRKVSLIQTGFSKLLGPLIYDISYTILNNFMLLCGYYGKMGKPSARTKAAPVSASTFVV
jgi:hypothetical protein